MKRLPTIRPSIAAAVVVGLVVLAGCGGAPTGQQPAAPAPATTTETAPAPPPAEPPKTEPATPAAEAPAPKPAPKRAATETKPATKPESAPIPKPEPVVKTVAAGTELELEMVDGVSSKSSIAGDAFKARVAKDVVVDGLTAIPAGTVVTGKVVEAVPLKKIGGQSKLHVEFVRIDLDGENVPLSASFSAEGKKETGKDAATIGGSAAGGALLGRILSKHDKGKGTAIGAVVGAAAGTAIAAKTKGEEIELGPGAALAVKLDAPVQVTVRR